MKLTEQQFDEVYGEYHPRWMCWIIKLISRIIYFKFEPYDDKEDF